jgi:hypothetical protein
MSDQAIAYVWSLGPEINQSQRVLLLAIAEAHSLRWGAAHVSFETLIEQTAIDRRYISRLLAKLASIVEYEPGVGRGNFGTFRFVNLPTLAGSKKDGEKVVKRWQKDGQKAVIRDTAIKEEDLNQELGAKPTSSFFAAEPVELNRDYEPAETNDDVENPQQSEIEKVLQAYANSPIVLRKTIGQADRRIARDLLTRFSLQQIDGGIQVASARKMASNLNNGTTASVVSLSYFAGAIAEVQEQKLDLNGYVDHARRWIARQLSLPKKPESIREAG